MSGHREQKNGDWFSWALIVFLFAVGGWPIALLLLFFKLFGSDEKKKTPPPLHVGTAAQESPDSRAKNVARQVVKSPVMKSSTARLLQMAGAVLAAVGLYYAGSLLGTGYALWDLLKYLGLASGGAAMLLSGISMDRAMRRYARYQTVMADCEAISFGQLSRTTGESKKRVAKDLQKMIERGTFGPQAYLNRELEYFFRSPQAAQEWERRQTAQREETPKEAEEGYSGILRSIRRANDRIADPILSEKISRLEEITAKIFRAVEEDPQKRSRIDTFLNYYLPTTQKLLDSYAEFEEAGVEGENLRQAKERIRKTMDSIVEGFEHQLDQLYQADAMDVDSDIRVMETMLHRDTASAEKDFGLHGAPPADAGDGGTAVQQSEEP